MITLCGAGDRGSWCIDTQPQAPCQLLGTDSLANSLRSYHPGAVNVVLADGSVQFLSESIDATVYKNLGTRAGGEVPKPLYWSVHRKLSKASAL